MKGHIFYVFMAFLFFSCHTQDQVINQSLSQNKTVESTKPKLVVGIVIDQMRYDYLTRFSNQYGEGGFKRLIKYGFNCKNNHFNYIPTYTGPGHASVYTGTTPKNNGIISNYWYDKELKKSVYVAGDTSVNSVGTLDKAGKMSPHRMKTTSFADENRLFTQMRGKTIGVSIKDRGAILPAGHTANAAYWFHGKDEGRFISSTFYMNELPSWVKAFNTSDAAESYLKVWNTIYDISTYVESGSDLNDFEGGFKGKETATFPYNLATLKDSNGGFDILKATPYGNSIVTDFAIAAIDAEALGKDNITDVLAVSYSSTDYVGHNFGVNSKEVEDTYIRLDKDIERLLNKLDVAVGKDNYTLFLTSDHGAIDVPAYLQSVRIPADYFDSEGFKVQLTNFLTKTYGSSDIIENVSNYQIFLNHSRINALGIELNTIQETIVNEIIKYKHIEKAFSAKTMQSGSFVNGVEALLENGYNQKRSGDVIIMLSPNVISYSKTGSTHGSGYNYDTHVPLLFYGQGIKQGNTLDRTVIEDIAPTMSALLGISFPNGSSGKPLEFVLD